MQLALIADIHGNLVALDAILADISRRRITQILCLGDVAFGGPQPVEVLQRLRELRCPVVMGNTDAWLLKPELKEQSSTFARNGQDIGYWCSQQLSAEDTSFIESFVATYTWSLNATTTLLAYHGSPRSFKEQLHPTTPDEQVGQAIGDTNAQVLAGGHTHQQMLRRYKHHLLINPGSVGMAMDRSWPLEEVRNPPWGEYAILNVGDNKLHSVGIEFCRMPFDIERFLAISFQKNMPHAEWAANEWLRA
ncbi:serine/threonine protein phosphatase [Dictyobacter alpinus]|uniref:Serine/threonine protein phosphatase n=1 Tax=Dictyobacter alpinus TaxID=2014873 RepID=A0A402BGF4_9CHLR|nr:metallophosphoesterase family protein [Dictyobacter alpinus]GCE30300.1 serine/threonine protein phosphatase [Dictyobacter alpinus]GCE30332.1 serine/threonine protein phosphatase [Dictyobacter alpinus]